ncbi:MAG: copper-translocating P-type ATPase [Patescibacteria group bacterium]|nr:copper-translocating P-type ATPase [Patescibacteria group bacterium]MDE2015468.1 copper-translocating P-type ATPase [Patescibacteria group bacterium]MDE2226916.1 copper-translocating P-type ATPase [Patescibacteria group bacterium]
MHPEIKQEIPGMCPDCGMALVAVKHEARSIEHSKHSEHEGSKDDFNKHAGHHTQDFLKKFLVSLVLTVPVLVYSDLPQTFFNWQAPQFPGSRYLQLLIGSIVFFYCGWVFIASAWRELKAKLPGMMTLIALAITTAYVYSAISVLAGGTQTLFLELTTLIAVMLLGHWIEMKSVQGAQGALKELSKLLPDVAEVIRGDKSETVPLMELKEGDLVFVRPGGKIPADGIVADGKSDVNEAIITGESKPVIKNTGAEVIAGTTNGDGSLKIRVAKIGEKTFLAGVMRLIKEAQASKSRLQILSDKAAFYLTIIAVASGIITLVSWLLASAGISFALTRLVAVLVIACPHALGLAIPLVAAISTTMAARNGFLIRQRASLERARKINIVLFDKTGTLTKGEYGVTDIIAENDGEVLRLAAAVDSNSEHFVSRAIVAEAKKRDLKIAEVKNFERIPGKGVRGLVDGQDVLVGGEAILSGAVADKMKSRLAVLSKEGKTIIYIVSGGVLLGAIALADIIREESREAIVKLKKAGVRTAMITGDSEDVASWVAEKLGIDEYFAKVLPGEKASKVKELQKRGLKVAMVGDGINDAPALTQADLGIAIGAGTNIAIESAGIILVKNDPRDILKIIKLSRLTYNKMVQNLFWATGYNVVALPLAAGVLASRGILLEPALAAVFMSLSTVIVAVNAVLLRREKL